MLQADKVEVWSYRASLTLVAAGAVLGAVRSRSVSHAQPAMPLPICAQC